MKQANDSMEIKSLIATIGLANGNGEQNVRRLRKHKQIVDYLTHIKKAVNTLSRKRELVLVDCACGKSYLSFIANHYLTHIEKRKVKFICIDYNQDVINSCRKAAKDLSLTNMTFICDDIQSIELEIKPDIVYSLHACDNATDLTIATGIRSEAKYIMTVSCCQRSVRERMSKHPLTMLTKHGAYKERIADMISDSMRASLLEAMGYQSKIFEYVPTSETPKNIMLRAMRLGNTSKKNLDEAMKDYSMLKEMFHTDVKLLEYLQSNAG